VLDESLAVVEDADAFLRQVRFGRDGSELTTRSYAGGIALFLRWCARTGRHWHDGVAALGLFVTWLRHAGPQASGVDVVAGGQVLAGPGTEPVRGARRINGVLTAVREPIGAPMRPDAINEVIAGCARRAGIEHVTPHRLRHAFGSNLADAGGGLDEIATLMGHASMSSSQVYLHPDPARLREAVDRVRSPRELAGTDR
jgi:site-specific recombinase XerD